MKAPKLFAGLQFAQSGSHHVRYRFVLACRPVPIGAFGQLQSGSMNSMDSVYFQASTLTALLLSCMDSHDFGPFEAQCGNKNDAEHTSGANDNICTCSLRGIFPTSTQNTNNRKIQYQDVQQLSTYSLRLRTRSSSFQVPSFIQVNTESACREPVRG